jgi:hypothetical protein
MLGGILLLLVVQTKVTGRVIPTEISPFFDDYFNNELLFRLAGIIGLVLLGGLFAGTTNWLNMQT